MKTIINIPLLLFTVFLLGTCFSDDTERQCLENNLTPNNELSDTGSIFETFAEKLESYTGLNSNEKFSLTVNCNEKTCVVNPNGTAAWEARHQLYMNNMMSNVGEVQTTLDGCLCYSTNVADFQTCMEEVRTNMMAQLDTIYAQAITDIVERDGCSLFQENCIVA